MKREFSAGGMVFHRNKEIKILLIKDHVGKWTLPKGLIEKGETSEQAALREVKEETGLENLRVIEKLGNVKYFYQLKGEKIFKIVTFFLMEAKDEELKPEWEIQDAKWFKIEEILEKNSYKNSIEIFKKGLEFIKKNKSNLLKFI